MNQEQIKAQLDKINLLFNVFMKDGLLQTSHLERDLLLEQIKKLEELIAGLPLEKHQEERQILEEVAKPETNTILETRVPVEKEDVFTVNELVEEEKTAPEIESKEPQLIEEKKEMEPIQISFVEEEKEEIPLQEIQKEEKYSIETATSNFFANKEFSQNKPTRDLKQVIDLNKSFILRAELFNNNQEEYSSFINQLNLAQSEEESFNLLMQKAQEKSWTEEDKVFELLQRAVEKRFMPLI